MLGLSWGLGHACALLTFGLPVVLLDRYLPGAFQRAAEVAIGVLIAGFAIRLLLQWRQGAFHLHAHAHGGRWHAHPHAHANGHPVVRGADRGLDLPPHDHPHGEALGRSPLASFGIGLLHGVGGSAGAGVLVVAAFPGATAVAGLAVFAAGTALSMAVVSAIFGHALIRRPVVKRLAVIVPALGVLSLLLGTWYALAALGNGFVGA